MIALCVTLRLLPSCPLCRHIRGYIIGHFSLGLNYIEYWTAAYQSLEYNDIAQGCSKPFVFAFVISSGSDASMAFRHGRNAGVGRATTQASSSHLWVFVSPPIDQNLVNLTNDSHYRTQDRYTKSVALRQRWGQVDDLSPGRMSLNCGREKPGSSSAQPAAVRLRCSKIALGLISTDSGSVISIWREINDLKEKRCCDPQPALASCFKRAAVRFDNGWRNVAYPLLNRATENASLMKWRQGVDALRFVELSTPWKNFERASGGMRRRVGIARAVITSRIGIGTIPPRGPIPLRPTHHGSNSERTRFTDAANLIVTQRYQDGQLMAF